VSINIFEDCLKKGRLKKIEPDIERAAKELETAKGEIERGRQAYVHGRWEDVVTQSYFAMHRCARAAINSRGYRDTNLYGLLAGLEHLFVESGQLPKGTGKRISEAKDLKDTVYNGGRASIREARPMLLLAQNLVKATFEMLKLPGFESESIEVGIPERPDPQRSGQPASNEGNFSREVNYNRDPNANRSGFNRGSGANRFGRGGATGRGRSSWSPSGTDDDSRWRPGYRAAR
jgi:uncharacterized protein (UPF0332 family)